MTWIKMKDEKPKDDGNTLLLFVGVNWGKKYRDIGYYHNGYFSGHLGGKGRLDPENVTHWMVAPELPED